LVATTALDWPEDKAKTAIAGFHFHLVKPVSSSAIRVALDRFRAVLARRGVKVTGGETPSDDPTG
jgi:hypothetical protein